MSGSLTIKAFLKGAGVNEEIRRFAVDQSVCTNFSYVTSKITQVFPDLTRKQFQLFWKDSDGDLILFSTDEELTDALGFVTDGVFRIFINVKNEEVNPEGGIRHKGVLCDGCEKEINGPRFKCIVCPDYDLCSLCERKSMHQDHDMLRICRPRERPTFMGFPFGAMAQGPPPPPPPPHHPGHHHHHPGGHPPPPPPPPHAEGAEGQFGPPPFFGAQFGPGMWPWKRWRKRCWRRWMSQQAGGEGAGWGQHSRDPSEDGSRHGDEPRCKDSNKGGDACGEKQPGNNDGPGCSQQQRCGDQGQAYLQNIGTTVAAMLDPLGIDVHVDIENNNQRTHISGRQRGQEQEKEQEDDVEMRPDSEQAAAAPAAASGCEGPGTPRMEDLTIRSPPQRDQTEAGEWTMLSKENAANECSDDARVVYPTLPSSRIAEALEQMKAMGYSDDGGWLTSLLETKGGDINKVLDSLQPKPQ